MTPAEGKKRITKLLGSKAMWRDSGRPTSPEQRAEKSAQYKAASAALKASREALEARKAELLKADERYQQIRSEYDAALTAQKACSFGGYRLAVGLDKGFAFIVSAEGDNWADVVRKLEDKLSPVTS